MSMPGVAAVMHVILCCIWPAVACRTPIHTYWVGAILPGYIYTRCSFVLCILDGINGFMDNVESVICLLKVCGYLFLFLLYE